MEDKKILMESIIYDLIDRKLLGEWRDAVEKNGDCGFILKETESKKELLAKLKESDKKLFAHYILAIENKIEFIYYNLNVKILNFGIKIGIKLQKSFTEFDLE